MYFRETNCVIHWIVIYPADSVIHLLSNSALERREESSLMWGHPCDKYEETFHSFEWNRNTLWWRNVKTGHRVSPKWSVHTSANLIFHFSNKNGKRKYNLSLSYLHILKYRKREKKRKWSGKSIIFSFFLCACDILPLNLSPEPLFLCWEHSVPGMKTVELTPHPPPPPLSPTNFHVFPLLSSTVDYQQLKPSGKSRKVNQLQK